MFSALKADKKVSLKNELSEMYQNSKNNRATGKNYLMRRYGAAAIITMALLISTSLIYFMYLDHPSDQLFDKYYKPYPIASSTRGINLTPSEIIEAYQEESYEKVILLYEALELKEAKTQMIYANSLLLAGRPDKAELVFRELARGPDPDIRQYANWYLALTLLKAEKNEQAKSQLIKLINEKMIHMSDAQNLLRELEE